MKIEHISGPNKFWIFPTIVGVFFVVMAGSIASSPGGGQGLSWLWRLVGLLNIGAGLLMVRSRTNYLKLTKENFTYRAGLRTVTIKWRDCSQFDVLEQTILGFQTGKYVVFNGLEKSLFQRLTTAITRATMGSDYFLPDTYGLTAKDLVVKMEGYRRSKKTVRHS